MKSLLGLLIRLNFYLSYIPGSLSSYGICDPMQQIFASVFYIQRERNTQTKLTFPSRLSTVLVFVSWSKCIFPCLANNTPNH